MRPVPSDAEQPAREAVTRTAAWHIHMLVLNRQSTTLADMCRPVQHISQRELAARYGEACYCWRARSRLQRAGERARQGMSRRSATDGQDCCVDFH